MPGPPMNLRPFRDIPATFRFASVSGGSGTGRSYSSHMTLFGSDGSAIMFSDPAINVAGDGVTARNQLRALLKHVLPGSSPTGAIEANTIRRSRS